MNMSMEDFLSKLVIKVAEHFGISYQNALESVARSKIANAISAKDYVGDLDFDNVCERLYSEISHAE